jgi:hypothetical protein
MEEKQTKTIHIGLTEAKKLGKPLFDYLTEDVKKLSDVQQTYVLGYRDGSKAVIELVMSFLIETKRNNDEMLDIVRGR